MGRCEVGGLEGGGGGVGSDIGGGVGVSSGVDWFVVGCEDGYKERG